MYQEQLRDVIDATREPIATVIVPKNSGLRSYVWQVLAKSGLRRDQATRQSDDSYKLGDITFVERRGEDIPQVVRDYGQRGDVVIGITGDDLFDEFMLRQPDALLRVENTWDWFDPEARYFRPALCFVNASGAVQEPRTVALNRKYERTSKLYLEPWTPEVTLYSGGTEESVQDGTNDACIEIVYTGESLEKAGLQIADIVRFTDLVAISPLGATDELAGSVLRREFGTLADRLHNPTGSYSSELLANPEKARRKGMEEMYELVMASAGRGDLVAEAADVVFTAAVMLVQQGATLDDLVREMRRRQ